MTAIEAVLFDWDDTLAGGWEIAWTAALHETLAANGYTIALPTIEDLIGTPSLEVIRQLTGLDAADVRRIYEDYAHAYIARHARHERPLDGAAELLDSLDDAGVRLAVVTNKRERTVGAVLDHFGWAHRFEAVVGGDTTAHLKPHPAPALAAVSRLGIPPTACLLIGDAVLDIQCGLAAGLGGVICVTSTEERAALEAAGATHVVGNLHEARTLLLDLARAVPR